MTSSVIDCMKDFCQLSRIDIPTFHDAMVVGPSQHDMGGNPCVSGGAVEGIHHADSHRGAEQSRISAPGKLREGIMSHGQPGLHSEFQLCVTLALPKAELVKAGWVRGVHGKA